VYESGTPGFAVGFTPVGKSRHRCTDRARESHADRERGGATHARIALCDRIQRERRRPRTERQIGYDRMERVAKPDAMSGVLGLLSDGSRRFVRASHGLAQWFCDPVELRTVHNLHQHLDVVHRVLSCSISFGSEIVW
jgi:hypothetical protein